jgi:luciferase family oxidoreductase group 1
VGDALRSSVDLARLADELGYFRYWLAEHHGTPALGCASPEAMIGPVAAATSRLRVGSGGVMLPHYSPLKVAETFGMLAGLFPGRVDLGIGRAAGTSQAVSRLLQRDRRQPPVDDFREQLDELLRYFRGSTAGQRTFPQFDSDTSPLLTPEMWLLGSSPQSAVWAAELALSYVFADFINPEGAAIAAYYREHFQPSAVSPQPRMAVAAWAICADTDEEAVRLSLSARMMLTLLHRGRLIPVPTVERAEAFLREEAVSAELLLPRRRLITGSPATVRAGIEALVREYDAEEVLIVNILHDHTARRRSYELIARQFGLPES